MTLLLNLQNGLGKKHTMNILQKNLSLNKVSIKMKKNLSKYSNVMFFTILHNVEQTYLQRFAGKRCGGLISQNYEIQDKSRKINKIIKLSRMPPYCLPAVIFSAFFTNKLNKTQ